MSWYVAFYNAILTPVFTELVQRLAGPTRQPRVKLNAARCVGFSSAITLTRGMAAELRTMQRSKS